ncbi:MAG: carbohydrate ABC transporter permease [Candidatus Sumerlaeia bacterium]|nr:carbohydrate ABC transporter permease [Candidatus Sumerlaeia bacterium]
MATRALLGEFERRRGLTAWGLRAVVLLLYFLTLSTVLPLVWIAGNAFKTPEEYNATPLSLLPRERSYVAILDGSNRGPGKATVSGQVSSEVTRETYRLRFVTPEQIEVTSTASGGVVLSAAVSGDGQVTFDGVTVALRGRFEAGDGATIRERRWHAENYAEAWSGVRFIRHSLNSVVLMILTWTLHLTVNALGAYALSRLRFPGDRIVLFLFLLTLMVPWFAIFIPLYLTVTELGLTASAVSLFGTTIPLYGWPAVVIPAGFNAFFLVLFKGFFDGLPGDLIDASRIDGATELQTFRLIALPLARPIVAVITVFSLLATWNDFLWPYLVIGEADGEPLMVRLYNYELTGATNEAVLAALAMAMVPPLVLFLIFQRHIAAGFTLSGIKG